MQSEFEVLITALHNYEVLPFMLPSSPFSNTQPDGWPQDWFDALAELQDAPSTRTLYLLGIPTARVSIPKYAVNYRSRNKVCKSPLSMNPWILLWTELEIGILDQISLMHGFRRPAMPLLMRRLHL